MRNLIITDSEQLVDIVHKTVKVALSEFESEKKAKENRRLLTINQVAKLTGKAHLTISRMIRDGLLKATKDNRIPEVELQKYLEGK